MSGIYQVENEYHTLASNQFIEYYNKNQFDAIFNMFSNDMKNALPLESSNHFFEEIKAYKGDINKIQYLKKNYPWTIYKLTYERDICLFKLAVDDKQKISGLHIEPYVDENLPIIERNITTMNLPFNGEWYVVWGGDTKHQNYHIINPSQKNAIDFVIMDSHGKTYTAAGKSNSDYYAFNQPILSPCHAEVIMAVDGVNDNIPGNLNPYYACGNSIILKTINNEFIVLAHFKQNSVAVKKNNKVSTGELLGYCGNSGNSSEPHLHIHIQNIVDMNIAVGVKGYFNSIIVNNELKSDYSPIKGERVENNYRTATLNWA